MNKNYLRRAEEICKAVHNERPGSEFNSANFFEFDNLLRHEAGAESHGKREKNSAINRPLDNPSEVHITRQLPSTFFIRKPTECPRTYVGTISNKKGSHVCATLFLITKDLLAT